MATDVSTAYRAPAYARAMADAARRWLDSLTEKQRAAATYPFEGDERYVWDYRPVESTPRSGLWRIAMTREQQDLAFALLDIGLSTHGARKVREIMELETILREKERIEHAVFNFVRDPELYFFAVFGEPGGKAPWAWKVGGHHVGVHFTIVDGDMISPTPLFFGANPAEVVHGPLKGTRTLPEEEDVARDLLARLEPEKKTTAIFSATAPRDIITDRHRTAKPGELARGLTFAAMSGEQREQLVRLIRVYVERVAEDASSIAWRKIEGAGLDEVSFAWAGPEERNKGHYYAITGPTFMIEYDNTQNDANHIHSVWREYDGDWGADLLAAHYAEAPHHHE